MRFGGKWELGRKKGCRAVTGRRVGYVGRRRVWLSFPDRWKDGISTCFHDGLWGCVERVREDGLRRW